MTYEIIIKNETSNGGGGGQSAIADNQKSATTEEQHKKSTSAEENGGKVIGKIAVAFNQVKSRVMSDVNYSISTTELRTGSSRDQRVKQFNLGIATSVANMGESILLGAVVGGGVGAIIGAVGSMISFTQSQWQKENTMAIQRQQESVQISQALERAGAKGSR